MPQGYQKPPRWVGLWIALCALLNCAGWGLSAFHQLNAIGYSIVLALAAVGFIVWFRGQSPNSFRTGIFLNKLPRRFKRWFPLGFLILASMAFIGGVLYAPNNYDALSYRLPRILHWLADQRWCWIHTDFQRLNTRACGYEWIAAPLMVLMHSDRLLFLIDVASFLMLPGLLFSTMTRMGVRPRAAWYWMWLLPTGYCYLLQAGSVANDMFSAVFALAALDFALRARVSGKISDVWLAILAAALLTGGKTSNLPAVLAPMVALLFSLRLLKGHLVATTAVVIIALGASFLPMAVLNYKYCGDWSGQAAEKSLFMKGSPVLRVANNTALLTIQNLVPPVFPMAKSWNDSVQKAMSPSLKLKLEESFETAGAHLGLDELQVEEVAGLGFGITLLLLATFVGTWFSKAATGNNSSASGAGWFQNIVQIAAIFSLLPFMWVSGLSTAARLITPYYALIIPLFLRRQTNAWTHKNKWWKPACALVFLMAAFLLVVSPSRPIWPSQTVLAKMGDGKLVQRAKSVYAVYSQRADGFAPAVKGLPGDLKTLGLIAADVPETSLWKPFGSRRVEYLVAEDGADYLRALDINYVLINPVDFIGSTRNEPFGHWLADRNAEVAQTIPMTLRASAGPMNWLLVKVKQ